MALNAALCSDKDALIDRSITRTLFHWTGEQAAQQQGKKP